MEGIVLAEQMIECLVWRRYCMACLSKDSLVHPRLCSRMTTQNEHWSGKCEVDAPAIKLFKAHLLIPGKVR
jgi:hypothetical protein